MVLFSQRYGYKKVRDTFQKESIDQELKVALWNFLIENNYFGEYSDGNYLIWTALLHQPGDNYEGDEFQGIIKKYFLIDSKWYEIYDLLEFIAQNCPSYRYAEILNRILTHFCSAYRLINDSITEITSEEEIAEIETAIKSPLEEINIQLKNALHKLSDRENPDYRHSIKESISAVECICRKITGKSTLGKAIADLEKKGLKLNTQLREGLNHLYSYTNDENGIRHTIMDLDEEVNMEEARFMLVTCSAFVNYLLEKASKLGIALNNK